MKITASNNTHVPFGFSPILWSMLLVVMATHFSYAQQKDKLQIVSDDYVNQGNVALEKDFIEAEKYYRRAISKKATNAKSSYNLGNAYYTSGFYDEALSKLIQAAENGNKKEKHAAYHNIGNTLMQGEKCKEAVEAYKNALRNNPADEETRYNLALAKECAKEQGGGGKDDQKDEKEKDKENQDQKEDSEKQQDKNEQNKDEGDKDKNPKDDSDQKDNNGKPNDEEGDQKNPNQKNQQGKLSPQQVKNLLEAMNNEEKKVQEKMNATKTKGVKIKTDKDW
jgi:tetratricopeptide (TPR) repeat protein